MWISVKDRLPEINVGVLITNGEIVTAASREDWGCSDKLRWTGHEFGGYEWDWDFAEDTITHWMPLPEPPGGDKE